MSVGIIGGADGPTAIFVSSNINWQLIAGLAVVVAAGIVICLICRKKKRDGGK